MALNVDDEIVYIENSYSSSHLYSTYILFYKECKGNETWTKKFHFLLFNIQYISQSVYVTFSHIHNGSFVECKIKSWEYTQTPDNLFHSFVQWLDVSDNNILKKKKALFNPTSSNINLQKIISFANIIYKSMNAIFPNQTHRVAVVLDRSIKMSHIDIKIILNAL